MPQKKLPYANIAKYYLQTLILPLSRRNKTENPLVQKLTKKNAIQKCLFGPLTEFLKGDDDNVRFESVVVLKETRSRLPKTASEMFAKQNFPMAK